MVQIFISSSKQKQSKNGKYTVYCIELYLSGKCFKIERRYSEFHELHRTLNRILKHNQDRFTLPILPPKKVRNLSEKLIEQRRKSLEEYLKNLIKNIGLDQIKELNDFLNVSFNDSSICKSNKSDNNQPKFLFKTVLSNDQQEEQNIKNFNFHQCMIGLKNDYLLSIDYDLPNYFTINKDTNSLYSDSSSNKSNCETNSCASNSSTSGSSLSDNLEDIIVMGSLCAIYDKSYMKFQDG